MKALVIGLALLLAGCATGRSVCMAVAPGLLYCVSEKEFQEMNSPKPEPKVPDKDA